MPLGAFRCSFDQLCELLFVYGCWLFFGLPKRGSGQYVPEDGQKPGPQTPQVAHGPSKSVGSHLNSRSFSERAVSPLLGPKPGKPQPYLMDLCQHSFYDEEPWSLCRLWVQGSSADLEIQRATTCTYSLGFRGKEGCWNPASGSQAPIDRMRV